MHANLIKHSLWHSCIILYQKFSRQLFSRVGVRDYLYCAVALSFEVVIFHVERYHLMTLDFSCEGNMNMKNNFFYFIKRFLFRTIDA